MPDLGDDVQGLERLESLGGMQPCRAGHRRRALNMGCED